MENELQTIEEKHEGKKRKSNESSEAFKVQLKKVRGTISVMFWDRFYAPNFVPGAGKILAFIYPVFTVSFVLILVPLNKCDVCHSVVRGVHLLCRFCFDMNI